MRVERIRNQYGGSCVLLRESYRDKTGKPRKRTVANLTKLPDRVVEGLKKLLDDGVVFDTSDPRFAISRTLPHGHVAAILGVVRKLGLEELLHSRRSPVRDLVVAMVVARLIEPQSKLATARALEENAHLSTLAEELELPSFDEEDLYDALDWLAERQAGIEKKLARRHLQDGALILYDLTSTYFEGRHCPLAAFGHSRDHRRDKMQINFGLLCTAEGCPVAVEVFEGNASDPGTLGAQVKKVVKRFRLKRVVFVGDRGMITDARVREDLAPIEGMSWITALRAEKIQKLARGEIIQPSLFDERDLVEVQDPAFPGERLVACRNPFLAEERSRKRDELLAATELELEKIVRVVERKRNPLRGRDEIGIRVGKVIGRFKVGKHFDFQISDDRFVYARNEQRIAAEAALDGIYVIRTNVEKERLSAEEVVGAYKSLARVERAFRSFKTIDLRVRPIFHRLPQRVRAHVFLCMLAYYVEWHMRRALAPILFDDEDPESAAKERESIVAPAKRSKSALKKARTKKAEDGRRVHSFRTLLRELATLSRYTMAYADEDTELFDRHTSPTPLQARAFELLDLPPPA